MNELVKYEAARAALEIARTYDEVKDIRDKAIALATYARQAKDLRLVQAATEIKVRAERRTAQMLDEARAAGDIAEAHRPGKCSTAATLNDLGVSRTDASRWGKLSDMTDEQFEEHVEYKKQAVERAFSGNVHFSSDSEEWYTPKRVIDLVVHLLGAIDIDPCSNETKNVPSGVHYTKSDNGLCQAWLGRVYMNPPYGNEISSWTEKLLAEYTCGNTTEAIALVPARVDTAWFRPFTHAVFISGRLKFSESDAAAPFPSAVLYLGSRWETFKSVFKEIGEPWKKD